MAVRSALSSKPGLNARSQHLGRVGKPCYRVLSGVQQCWMWSRAGLTLCPGTGRPVNTVTRPCSTVRRAGVIQQQQRRQVRAIAWIAGRLSPGCAVHDCMYSSCYRYSENLLGVGDQMGPVQPGASGRSNELQLSLRGRRRECISYPTQQRHTVCII